MRVGTSHFVDYLAACDYYRKQGFTAADVRAKLERGDIRLGKPACEPWEWVSVIPGEGRYQVESKS